MIKKIRVLIVDDSAVVRQVLKDILSSDDCIEVIGTAADPMIAASKISAEVPDVITLDVEMPRMDGITFLQKIMSQHPIPVVICSSLSAKGCETTLQALESGAVTVIQKPVIGIKEFLKENYDVICKAVKDASYAKLIRIPKSTLKVSPKLSADVILKKSNIKAMANTTDKVVVVGASTGGTEALKIFLEKLPIDSPGIVIVQHMPEKFTAAFAKRLNTLCKVTVKEACDHDTIIRGQALIAPGNRHLALKRNGAKYYVELKDGPLVSHHKPSVDVLFRSTAIYAGKNAIGVIMSGMGDDGARGMAEMKEAGAINIAQNEATCVVFGMPKEAIKRECVDKILPLSAISAEVVNLCKS